MTPFPPDLPSWEQVLVAVQAVARGTDESEIVRVGVAILSTLAAVPVRWEQGPSEAGDVSCGAGRLCFDGALEAARIERLRPVVEQMGLSLDAARTYAELDHLVQREMQTSVERENAMRLVLDSMREGLLVCRLDGSLSDVRSKAVAGWFGDPTADARVWSYLAGDDAQFELRFSMGFEQIADDFLPFELVAAQMPQFLTRGEQVLGFSYQYVEGEPPGVLVCIRDATAEFRAQHADREARELATTVGHLLEDREGFLAFVEDMDAMLTALSTERGPGVVARLVHTLKGNAATFGFQWFAEQCHELESRMAADDGGLAADEIPTLRESWRRSLTLVRPFLEERSRDVRVTLDELSRLVECLEQEGVEAGVRLARSWTREPIEPSLRSLARQASHIAKRCGKAIEVTVSAQHARVPDPRVRPLLGGLVHAIRNAIDHGLETPMERRVAGKSEVAQLELRCHTTPHGIVFAVVDDGRGVDWERVANKARALGLPAETPRELTEALFHQGVSTKEQATELSGRGVGMSALREMCRALGGDAVVETQPGRGTSTIFTIPLPLGRRSFRPAPGQNAQPVP